MSISPTLLAALQQHERTQPEAVAIERVQHDAEEAITYSQLLPILRSLGKRILRDFSRASPIALLIQDSFFLALAELACALIGVPFLPLDVDDNASFRARQSESCGCGGGREISQAYVERFWKNFVSAGAAAGGGGGGGGGEDGGDENRHQESQQQENEQEQQREEIIMYYCFTSGSTSSSSSSLPTCVVVAGSQLLQYLRAFEAATNTTTPTTTNEQGENEQGQQQQRRRRRILALSNPTFDPSIADIFGAAVFGHTLVTATRAQIRADVTAVVEAARPTHVVSSPALWSRVSSERFATAAAAADDHTKMFLALGGEAMPPALIRAWRERVDLFCIFGLTEAVVYQSLFRVPSTGDDLFVGLGRPLGDMRFFVRLMENDSENENFRVGELILFSPLQMAMNYEDRRKSTGDLVRVPASVVSSSVASASSGDEIELDAAALQRTQLVGRADFQVKISGRRVSLEDVEASVEKALSFCVDKCVALKVGAGALAAVFSLNTEQFRHHQQQQNNQEWQFTNSESLRFVANSSRFLRARERLSSVMILPRSAAAFPQNKNGKIDRRAVAEIFHSSSSATAAREAEEQQREDDQEENQPDSENQQHPRDQNQSSFFKQFLRVVGAVWASALSIASLPPAANFFILGGDSLTAARMSRELVLTMWPELDGRTRRQQQHLFDTFSDEFKIILSNFGRNNNSNSSSNNINDFHNEIDNNGNFIGPRAALARPQLLNNNPTLGEFSAVVFRSLLQNQAGDDAAAAAANENNFNSFTAIAMGDGGDEDETTTIASELSRAIKRGCCFSVWVLLKAVVLGAFGQNVHPTQFGLNVEDQSVEDEESVAGGGAAASSASSSVPATAAKMTRRLLQQSARIYYPLHDAVRVNNLDVVQLLTSREFGVKPTDSPPQTHVTPLHVAAMSASSLPMLRFLLEEAPQRGSSSVRTSRHQSLLHFAARSGADEVCRYLVETAPALVAVRDRWQRCAIHWAILNGHDAAARLLVEAEAAVGLVESNRTAAQLKRLTAKRTSLPVESLVALAERVHGADSDFVRIAQGSVL